MALKVIRKLLYIWRAIWRTINTQNNSEVISLSHYVQGQNEDILKIVGRAVLTLHLHGETLSSDKVSSMIACYAEEEPVRDDENQRLFALAIQMLS
jgi:hypothetical protein